MKKIFVCLTILFSIFLFNNKINAQGTVIWTGRGDGILQGTFTSEHLNKIIEYNDLDTSIYDSFVIYDNSGYKNSKYFTEFGIYFYNSDDYKNQYVKYGKNSSSAYFYNYDGSKGVYYLQIYYAEKTDFYDMMNFDWFNYEQSLQYIVGNYQKNMSSNDYETYPFSGLTSDYPIPITITGKGGHIYTNLTSEKVVIYNTDANSDYSKIKNFRYAVIPETVKYLYKHSAQWWVQGTSTFGDNKTGLSFSRYEASSLDSWSPMSQIDVLGGGLYITSFQDFVDYSYYDIWNNDFSEILYCGDVETECTTASYEFNVNFHLNGGSVFDTNEYCNEKGCYILGNIYEDYEISLNNGDLGKYLMNVDVEKPTMQFIGWYYDENLTQKVEFTDTIDNDVHLYAKYQYKNVEDFLNNTNFNSYTFDENYQYAVISLNNQNNREIYLGLDIFTTNLEVYKYNKINLDYEKGSNMCLTPIFSKENKYYYQLSDSLDNNYEVLIITKDKLKGNYNFLLSDNAHVTYTNDLKQVVIKDETGNDITTDVEDSYNYSQDNLLNSENDLLDIFKDLINNKDNNVLAYFNQVWNYLKRSRIFTYFITLIIGSLIILIIKAAAR